MHEVTIPYTYKVTYVDGTTKVEEFESREEIRWFLMHQDQEIKEWELINSQDLRRY